MARPSPPERAEEGALAGIAAALFRRVDIASLVAFRIGFGLLATLQGLDLLGKGYSLRWIERTFFFTYPGFHWVSPPPGIAAHLLCYALAGLGLLIAAGACYRLCAALFFLGFTWVSLIDQTDYMNHFYLISLISFVLVFLPAHRALSVDAWLRPGLRSDTTPAWTVFTLRAQLGMVYLFGGLAKLEPDWLVGLPPAIWMPLAIELPLLDTVAGARWFALAIAWGGLLFDLLVVPALLYRRTRPYAFAAAVGFHLSNDQLFNIGMFPWLAISATLIFFDPDWPRRVFNWPRRPKKSARRGEPFAWSPRRRAVVILLALYFGIHALLPLRHFAYPGRTSWTEEGHGFAWRMMLRHKLGLAVFKLEDPTTGRSWIVDPAGELTPKQLIQLPKDPRRLHQYANHLADLAETAGEPRPRVQAMTLVSLNGRKAVPIVDPTVDLADQPEPLLWHSPWILGLEDDRFASDPVWQDIARGLFEKYERNAYLK